MRTNGRTDLGPEWYRTYVLFGVHGCTLLERVDAAIDYLDARLAESQERLELQLTIGKQYQALDRAARHLARLEEERDDWRERYIIARYECAWARARIADLEQRLDVVYTLALRARTAAR
jgi:hypothetical protein